MSSRTWVACEEPEREPDAFVVWCHTPCRGCHIKARAQISRFPDDDVVQVVGGHIAERTA